ncbi:PP2C family protein-serine/threonine phosphatase [Phaeacidiphilus oryzae]|uniref:PP2C family protein-serine/threonine phosphatase n=1 Tax=Phaeacidiphilus oryzae TaxID=348818 RepID=UPI00055F701F|nr:PP2C family protein-serine/threonine phosphatase [Phaeacidiphilus oryzae]
MTHQRHSRAARPLSADELLSRLGRLTEQALERAELQQARVELAEALQRELLPIELPELPGLSAAACYAPARHGLDIGGDWFDGFWLPDGTVAFSLGDVQGHDVEAAVFMGQVRIGLRAVAAGAADPGEALYLANNLLTSMDCTLFATCSFLSFDPVRQELRGARAGHLPAIWATSDGRSGIALDAGGPPLGVLADQDYPVSCHRLPLPGACALVTDGVVEGPSFPIEAGLAEVLRIVRTAVREGVRAGRGVDPARLAAQIIRVADLTGHADDAAVLVLSRR